MKEIIIDGNNFNDLESFYCEIDKLLTKDLDFCNLVVCQVIVI